MLDEFICNNIHSTDIDKVLNEFDDLKTELQTIYTRKGMQQSLDQGTDGWKDRCDRCPPHQILF